MKSRKGQAAMEYLMTYGWAILIVIVVVAALYAMGVFRIGQAPVACSPCFSSFAYIDYASGVLKVRSGSRELSSLTLIPTPAATLTNSWSGAVTPGTTLTSSGFTPGTTYSLNFTYVDADSGLTHFDTATLRA